MGTAGTPADVEDLAGTRKGLAEAVSCQVLWGVMPVYWKLLSGVSALAVLTSRMIWACVFVVALCALVKRVRFLHLRHDRRALRTFLVSGSIITVNWGVYIWATNNGFLLEASLGYYLCPLVTVAFGLLFFKERLSTAQKAAFALAAVGVGSYLAIQGGAIWISCALAITFSIYGAVKKKGGFPALPGMAFESLLTAAIGLTFLGIGTAFPAFWQLTPPAPDASAVTDAAVQAALLAGGGVLTAIPLLLYSAAANRLPLVVVGFLQYISPTLSMLLAVFLFGEAFTLAHALCFGLVWVGLAAVGAESVRRAGKEAPAR